MALEIAEADRTDLDAVLALLAEAALPRDGIVSRAVAAEVYGVAVEGDPPRARPA